MKLEDLLFQLETELFKAWYRVRGARPSSEPYVSGDSFRAIADHVMEARTRVDPGRVELADIVFVQSSEISRFTTSILPHISAPFVLITHNSDVNIDGSFSPLADDARLLHWFAGNALLRHPKMTAIPIGLENRFFHSNGVVRDFERLSRRPSRKVNRILHGFKIGNNPVERTAAAEALRATPLAYGVSGLNARKYRRLLARFGFVASPPGAGVDCFRTWEALYLGVVPIVKKSPFYEFFPGLPVLLLDDWNEVLNWDEAFLADTREILSPRIDSSPYLRFDYWKGLVHEAQDRGRGGERGAK
jgi:hypothetical protein